MLEDPLGSDDQSPPPMVNVKLDSPAELVDASKPKPGTHPTPEFFDEWEKKLNLENIFTAIRYTDQKAKDFLQS